MNVSHPPFFIGRTITIKSIRDFILDNQLTDNDTILLHQVDYDRLALEYFETYKERLPNPYLLLGVLIQENVNLYVQPGNIVVIENDSISIRKKPEPQFEPNRIIYRCENCGNLVDYDGGELSEEALKSNSAYLKKFGRDAVTEEVTGNCCEEYLSPEYEPYIFKKKEIDYSVVAGKLLMDLTDEDFEEIELFRKDVDDFGFLYYCRSERMGKIYFTRNEDSYSLRGYMLREYEKIYTTEQLIKAVIDWRAIK